MVRLVKAMVFPVVMYGCESWTIKKAEHRRTDAFELWCWRRLLRVPWPAKTSNQSILKEISPEFSLKRLMLTWNSNPLASWCKELTHWRGPWCWKRLRAGGEGDDWGWDGWMASPTQWTWVWVNSGSWWWTGKPRVLQSMRSQESDSTDWLTWTELMWGNDSLEKTLVMGKVEGRRRRGRQRMRWMASPTPYTWVSASSGSWWTRKRCMLQSMGSQSQSRLRDWTEVSYFTRHFLG